MKILSTRKLIVAILLVIFTSFALGTWAKSKFQDRQNVLHDLEVFAKVVEKVRSYYVDEVDTHEMMTKAIENMLRDLDPHSQFLSGLDYEDLMLSTQGQFGGLGIFISFRDNYPTVISPIEGTPADRSGLQGGDQIVEIEGMLTKGWHVQKAVRYLRGEPGTAVNFKISRPGLTEPIVYTLVREKITVNSISFYDMFGDYGYIRLSSFSKNTRKEMEDALKDLEARDPKALVLDLRSNPGGLLQAATDVSELFLDRDKLVVYTKGRYSQNNQKYYAGGARKFKVCPIIVMVNGASASAAEIVAGALQDWDAGFLVGQRSFGKGTVQTVFSLSDSQAVKLTTAKYYTPSGRSIHRDSGDREIAMEEADSEGQTIATARTAEVEGDEEVFQTSGGRDVHGGGGIRPDLEFEPQKYGELERRMERDALFFTFAVDYSTDHDVTENFEITDKILADFKALLAEREFKYDEKDFDSSIDYIKKGITREIVTKNFGRKAMYRVLLERDREFQEVLKILGFAPTLPEMFEYAQQQRSLKKASLK
jgi:carboxyl-terminal processing protease